MSYFLNLAKTVTEEVAAGRISATEAKTQLRINSKFASYYTVQDRIELLKKRKVASWDNPTEQKQLEIWTENLFYTMQSLYGP